MAVTEQKPGPEKGSRRLLLAYLAAAFGLPSAWAALKWPPVTGQPILGAVVLAATAVLIGLVGLAHQVWRKKYNDRVIDWISAGIDRRTTRFGKRYRAHLLDDLRFVDLKGLVGRFFDPDLSDVYVDVALRPHDPGKMSSSDLAAATDLADLPATGQRRLIADFLGKPRPRVLAVIGAPGTGKTTLLRHTAREMCLPRHPRQGRDVPILLYLRDHVAMIVAEPEAALPVLVASALKRYDLSDPAGWLEQRLRAGDCVVMLDGLDEVAQQEDRLAISEWVSVQVTRYPGNDFIVTSRPLGYSTAPVRGAITVQTQPFTPEQVNRFVHYWCLAELRRGTGSDDSNIVRRAAEEADDLLARLRAAPALSALTVNPLLLTMIATVHRHSGALPGSRAELYDRICEVLLWRRQEAKNLPNGPRGELNGTQKKRLMRVLAFEMMRRKVRDLSSDEVISILYPMLRRMIKDFTVEELLDDVASNGLFIERENGVRAFAHQTFQEYLAAEHIQDRHQQEILLQAVSDQWWREATLLYVARTDAGPVVEACLAASTLPALTLAFDCALEAGELAQDLRDKLDTFLGDEFAADAYPQHRRLMRGVLVARHLRDVIETDAGARICSRPISESIYRLFLEDMAERGQHRPLDIPADATAGGGDCAVTGMRASDAAMFVEWINELTGGPSAYRLPTWEEIQDPGIRDAFAKQLGSTAYGIWAAPKRLECPPRLCPLGGASRIGAVSETTIRELLKADFAGAPLTLGVLPLLIHASVAARILQDRAPDGVTCDLSVSLGPTVDLLRYLGDTLDSGQARDRTQAFGVAVARSVEGDLHNARSLIRDLDYVPRNVRSGGQVSVDMDHVAARYLARTVARDLHLVRDFILLGGHLHHRELAVTRNLELARDLGLAGAPDFGRSPVFGFARNPVRVRARDFGFGFRWSTHNLDLILDLELNLNLAHATAPFLGQALSQMLEAEAFSVPADDYGSSRDLRELTRTRNALAGRFAEAAGMGGIDYALSADSLADTVHSTIGELRAQLDGDTPSAQWALRVAARFERLAAGVFSREQRMEAPAVPTLRIIALCLAAEADALNLQSIGDGFRRIAGVITWLERRHSGADPATETIVLALI
jgi:hypothetical protein